MTSFETQWRRIKENFDWDSVLQTIPPTQFTQGNLQDMLPPKEQLREIAYFICYNAFSGNVTVTNEETGLRATISNDNQITLHHAAATYPPTVQPTTMLKINRIPMPTFYVYYEGNAFIGEANEYEFLELRCRIKEAKATGYYIFYDNCKIRIDANGRLESYPPELFDTSLKLLARLI